MSENLENEELPLEPIQYEDDSYESGEIVTGEQYAQVKDETVLLNPTTGETIDVKTLPPLERMKFVSNREGKTLNDPDKNCKHCHGRGYTSIDAQDGVPTPCKCLFKDFYEANPYYKNVEMPSYNRKYRRAMERQKKRKPVANPALEKRQKRINDLMVAKVRSMLAEEANLEAFESTEIESEILNSPVEVEADIVETEKE